MKNINFFHHCSRIEVSTSTLNDAHIFDVQKLSRSSKLALKYLSNQYFGNKCIVPFENLKATLCRKNKSVADAASNGSSWN